MRPIRFRVNTDLTVQISFIAAAPQTYSCQDKEMLPTHSITVHQENPKSRAAGVFEAQEERVSSI